jgi:phage gpG-like protein
MSFSFRVKSDGMTPVFKQLKKLGLDPTPILRAMGTTFKSITEGNFNSVGAAFRPAAWPKLLTVKEDKTFTPHKLIFSRTLASTLGTLAPHTFHLTVTPKQAVVSTSMPYASVHQFGKVIKAKKGRLRFKMRFLDNRFIFAKSVTIPARPFYPVNKDGTALTPAADVLITRAGERAFMRAVQPPAAA